MVISKDGSHIFAGDIVEIPGHGHAKVLKFMMEVKIMVLHDNNFKLLPCTLTFQKGSGNLLADLRPITARQGFHILLDTTTTIPCDHPRPSTLCLSKDNILVKKDTNYHPINDTVNCLTLHYNTHYYKVCCISTGIRGPHLCSPSKGSG